MELDLAESLAPVRAPEDLWRRIDRATVASPSRPARRSIAWGWLTGIALAAAALAVMFAAPAPSLTQLAASELARGNAADFRSSDPHEIARWLRDNAAVNVSIPSATKVEITGARCIQQRGVRIGEVLYRVAGRSALLLVRHEPAAHTETGHGQPSWAAHGQLYALAFSDNAQSHLACKLCHLD
jgi:hypothetical protein